MNIHFCVVCFSVSAGVLHAKAKETSALLVKLFKTFGNTKNASLGKSVRKIKQINIKIKYNKIKHQNIKK